MDNTLGCNMNFLGKSQSPYVVFEAIRLKGTNKIGVIKPDSDGCYTQVIGGLNAYNSNEDFYCLEAGKKFFQNDSSFMRKIQRGVLRAEYGHPKREPGMSNHEYTARILRIEETMVCGTWRQIWLSRDTLKDNKGRVIVPIMGKIYPSGPYRDSLVHAFESAQEQVCFSIRSFTNDSYMPGGGKFKRLLNIVSFDYVNEPGIWNAEKLLSPSMESLEEVPMLVEDVIKGLEKDSEVSLECSQENNEFRNQLADILEKESKVKIPHFARW